jgi:hypothetical protein
VRKSQAPDLRHGPKEFKRYENFFPIIADFVAESPERVRQRKAQISEAEWQRCADFGKEYRERLPSCFRDGSPMRSMIPCKPPAVPDKPQ